MPSEGFLAKTAALRELGGQRVWSLMISLFGDLARDPGDEIAGPMLSSIMSGLNVKPEAARVALYRLRNEGWIVSRKAGRISIHSLSEKGRAETLAASPLIYAPPPATTENWRLLLTRDGSAEEAEDLKKLGYVSLLPRVFMGDGNLPVPPQTLALAGSDAPDWLCEELEQAALRPAFAALAESLAQLTEDLGSDSQLTPFEVANLRCLVVHNWRRLVLKCPPLPGSLVGASSDMRRCHLLVSELLRRFPRPAIAEIQVPRDQP